MDKRQPTKHVVRDPDQSERDKLKDTIRMSEARRKQLLAEMGAAAAPVALAADDDDLELEIVVEE
jgi:hypothetical protein